jgi:hypothetical protein
MKISEFDDKVVLRGSVITIKGKRTSYMKKKRKLFTETKPLLVILFCIFIISSCKKPENLCTLTPEQAPEIRGIKLGMSYDEISEKFRIKCNLAENSISRDDALSESYKKDYLSLNRYRMSVDNVDYNNQGSSKEFQEDLKGADVGCFGKGNFIIGFNPAKFPELEGINSFSLSFDERKVLSGIRVMYANKLGGYTFAELKDSLDLSKFTNWEVRKEDDVKDVVSRGTLLCNNLIIKPQINHWEEVQKGKYNVWLEIQALTNDEVVKIQNKKEEEERRNMEVIEKTNNEKRKKNNEKRKKEEEEERKNETFKP